MRRSRTTPDEKIANAFKKFFKATFKIFFVAMEAAVAVMVAGLAGFGMYFITEYLLGYHIAHVLLYSMTIAAAAGAWTGIKVLRIMQEREKEKGEGEEE